MISHTQTGLRDLLIILLANLSCSVYKNLFRDIKEKIDIQTMQRAYMTCFLLSNLQESGSSKKIERTNVSEFVTF